MQLTPAEENYLKALYSCSLQNEAVSTNQLAEALQTTAASVTDMLKRLNEKNLVQYIKYQGASLLPQGKGIAIQIIRRHRLWEVFLVDKLGYTWDTIHPIAEQLEHIQSPDLIDRLDKFLGYPEQDPHGDPIPTSEGTFKKSFQIPLSQLALTQKATFTGVANHTSAFLQYLDKLNIQLGVVICLMEINDFDKSIQLSIENQEVMISHLVAENILVTPY